MELVQIIVLAIVQGIAEFLPISSSGHLVVVGGFFAAAGHPLNDFLEVEIVLHAGTLMTILVYYRKQIFQLLTEHRRVMGLIIIATIPAAVIGVLAKKLFAQQLESPLLAGFMLPLTGLILLRARKFTLGERDYVDLTLPQALLIGTVQAVAILPGISRSGTTIVAGLAMGLRRDTAANFSFLLAIPALAGAALLSAIDLWMKPEISIAPFTLLLGAAVAFAVGLVALIWLLRWLVADRLYLFAYWCLFMGVVVLSWQGWNYATTTVSL